MLELLNFITMLYGVLVKLYDDCIDNTDAFSFIYDKKIILEIMLILVSFYLICDPIFAILLITICVGMLISDIIIFVLKNKYPENNLSYAYDTPIYIFGAILLVSIILYIHKFDLTMLDYIIVMYIILIIIVEALYTFKSEKQNKIESEAGNIKLFTRIICMMYALMIYSIMLLNKSLHKYLPIIYFGFSYGLTSIISMLYLKYYYMVKKDETNNEKIDIIDIINKMFSI